MPFFIVTDCPKIYRKSVLHLLKSMGLVCCKFTLKQMQYMFAVNFGTLS